jgi:carboxylate-amine ligase
MLSDGPENSAWWEHRVIASRLGVPVVTLADLEHRNGALHARVRDRLRPVDVIYRRTDMDRLRDGAGRPTAVAEALLEPCRTGRLACVNAFGSGVGDDKLVHAYVEEMIRFYLGEEPVIPSVPTYDLCEPERLAECVDRLDELVVKPRTGHGGRGVVIGPRASSEDLDRLRSTLRDEPGAYVAQELVPLSRHPTVRHGALVPRHVDLRPFILSAGERTSVVPGGLTRVAFEPGELVVNSSQNGGGKATWVLA